MKEPSQSGKRLTLQKASRNDFMLKSMFYSILYLLFILLPVTVNAEEYKKTEEYKIVSFGDSTTATRGELIIYSHVLEKELTINDKKVKVINSGIGGNNTNQAIKRFQKDVLDHHPDLVIIQFGINDAAVDVHQDPPATKSRVSKKEYKNNLTEIVRKLKSQDIKVILMTPNPCRWTKILKEYYGKPPYEIDDPDGFNVILKDYAEIVRGISKSEKCSFIDIYKRFQDYEKMEGKSMDDFLLDGMHPNEQGHKMVADLLMKMILHTENEAE